MIVTMAAWVLGALGLGLLLVALVFLAECAASLLPLKPFAPPRDPQSSAVVLVPAHDESASISGTVQALRSQLEPQDRVLVVADNCSDDTAARAAVSGATVIERHDPDRRGKGYALRFGVQSLEAEPPDVVVVVDADCRLEPGSISLLVSQAISLQRPVQGEYTFTPATPTPLSMISTLALLVRNRVRPRGLRRLGLPCQLTGSGMAFPWPLLRDAPPLEAHLVEDLLLGIELARAGTAPFHSIEAQVTSLLPEGQAAAMQQRRRWEHGQIGTLFQQGPRTLWAGLQRRDMALLAMGADLIVPPMALLVGLCGLLSFACAGLLFLGGPSVPLGLALAALLCVVFGVGLGWLGYGRRLVPFRYLLAAPLYLLWKVPLYLSFSLGRRERRWRRTER